MCFTMFVTCLCVSCLFVQLHFNFTSTSLQLHVNFTSTALQFHFNFTSIHLYVFVMCFLFVVLLHSLHSCYTRCTVALMLHSLHSLHSCCTRRTSVPTKTPNKMPSKESNNQTKKQTKQQQANKIRKTKGLLGETRHAFFVRNVLFQDELFHDELFHDELFHDELFHDKCSRNCSMPFVP